MSKQDKFGKKKSGIKFDRNKTYASSEADIVIADQKQEIYKEIRGNERHERRVKAGLEDDVKKDSPLKEEVKIDAPEPLNKYDIKKYGTSEEAQKYLYHCHTCGKDIPKGKEFCNDKCKEYVIVYGYQCKWCADCLMCKFSKRASESNDEK